MKNRSSFNNLFSRDRKVLYIILGIVMISVLTLTVVYAALSTTLNINGNAEVTAASWDIYLDNVQLNSSSATTNSPIITNKTTVSFSTTLSEPGDFYEFTVDVVNNGSIDAMIDSVTKTPELTTEQAKYLKYVVEYQNGDSITTKQLVSKNSFVKLKIKIGFRNDISTSDIPEESGVLNLSFKLNYVQSDDSDENVTIDNNGKLIKVVSGDYDTVGSEICIGEECFYVISCDETSVIMLAKYNLYVGNKCTTSTSSSCTSFGSDATGIQHSTMVGYGVDPRNGVNVFSSTNYWYSSGLKSTYGTTYPAYVYDKNSVLYSYVDNYKAYLENGGIIVDEARLIKVEELEKIDCIRGTDCKSAPEWVYATSYWTGDAHTSQDIWIINKNGFDFDRYYAVAAYGVRPVIQISKSYF